MAHLRQRLIDDENLEPVPSYVVWHAMQNRNLRQNQYCNINEIVKLAGDINANIVVLGMYQKDGLTWRLNCTFLDLSNKKPLFRGIAIRDKSLMQLQEKMYIEILKRLEITAQPSYKKAIQDYTTNTTKNEKSYQHLLDGSQYNHQNEPENAKKSLNQAINEDSEMYLAYDERAKSEEKLGNREQAKKDKNQANKIAEKKGINSFRIFRKQKKKQLIPDKSFTETVNGVSFKMIFVEGGSFMMGYDSLRDGENYVNNAELHTVTLDNFLLAETEVTQELYKAVIGENPSNFEDCPTCAVENVSWEDAQKFIEKLNELTGKNYRLPTEAQWEYGARGGQKSQGFKYSGSNDLNQVAWYGHYSTRKGTAKEPKTYPVKTKKPNELGLYDLSGNVWEWCSDYYDEYFYKSKNQAKNSINPENKLQNKHNYRVWHGGSWHDISTNCQVALRYWGRADIRNYDLGFRLSLQE